MKLQVSQLVEGENHLTFHSDKEGWIRDVLVRLKKEGHEFVGPLEFDMRLTKIEPDYFLRGKIRAKVNEPCARCAEVFAHPIEHGFDLALARVKTAKTEGLGHSDDSDELDLYFFEGPELELDPVLDEQVRLSLPYQALCQENCKGICQSCGKNLNQGLCACEHEPVLSPFSVLKQLGGPKSTREKKKH